MLDERSALSKKCSLKSQSGNHSVHQSIILAHSEIGSPMQVDMYSFGVLLWEIITHEKPFRGQLRDFKVPEECSQSIAEMHEACLQLGPEKRPSAENAVLQIQQAIEEHEARQHC